jgi:hypothetical protein
MTWWHRLLQRRQYEEQLEKELRHHLDRSVSVGSQFFDTIGTPLLRGRSFSPQDTIKSPQVAIVTEKLARRLWPEIKDPGEALGKRLRVGRADVISCEIIGPIQ